MLTEWLFIGPVAVLLTIGGIIAAFVTARPVAACAFALASVVLPMFVFAAVASSKSHGHLGDAFVGLTGASVASLVGSIAFNVWLLHAEEEKKAKAGQPPAAQT